MSASSALRCTRCRCSQNAVGRWAWSSIRPPAGRRRSSSTSSPAWSCPVRAGRRPSLRDDPSPVQRPDRQRARATRRPARRPRRARPRHTRRPRALLSRDPPGTRRADRHDARDRVARARPARAVPPDRPSRPADPAVRRPAASRAGPRRPAGAPLVVGARFGVPHRARGCPAPGDVRCAYGTMIITSFDTPSPAVFFATTRYVYMVAADTPVS